MERHSPQSRIQCGWLNGPWRKHFDTRNNTGSDGIAFTRVAAVHRSSNETVTLAAQGLSDSERKLIAFVLVFSHQSLSKSGRTKKISPCTRKSKHNWSPNVQLKVQRQPELAWEIAKRCCPDSACSLPASHTVAAPFWTLQPPKEDIADSHTRIGFIRNQQLSTLLIQTG